MGLSETGEPRRANFVPKGLKFNIFGRGQLGDVT